jgi:uncharacterized protein (DUF1800 family)
MGDAMKTTIAPRGIVKSIKRVCRQATAALPALLALFVCMFAMLTPAWAATCAVSQFKEGLVGEYFNNMELNGAPTALRLDPAIDFIFDTASEPIGGVPPNLFSVRWTGEIVAPVSGPVTFSTSSDDGVRLWVNNQQIINNWTAHPATTDTALPIQLVAGQRYPIRLEYFQAYGLAVIQLRWSYNGSAPLPVPRASLTANTAGLNLSPSIEVSTTSSNFYISPASISVLVDGKPGNGVITRLELFEGTNKLGEFAGSPWTFNWNNVVPGTYTLRGRATDSNGVKGDSLPIQVTVSQPPLVYTGPYKEAARFLTQSTFGPTFDEILTLAQNNLFSTWLDQQFSLPIDAHWDYVENGERTGTSRYDGAMMESFWRQAVRGPDQLRQRVTFALSEIMVVSTVNSALGGEGFGLASHYDILNRNAFGNFRTLLEEVSLSPAMGKYLSHLANEKEDPASGRTPDENYAREVMQLFSIGLWQLNQDGTRKLDAQGKPIPTYTQKDILGMARVFTGWSWESTSRDEGGFRGWYTYPGYSHWRPLMVDYPQFHSTSAKEIINGVVIPPNTPPRESLRVALNTLFNHPNVGPFIGRQLIKRLVTSNPSPAYVSRVAAAFNNNSLNVRGDMKAVIRAVLLDPEARDSASARTNPQWGKVREPIIRYGHWLRAFDVKAQSGLYRIWNLEDPVYSLGQNPLRAPSVFNFFRPEYTPPGAIAAAQLTAPEFQIIHETTITGATNFFEDETRAMSPYDSDSLITTYTPEMAWADQPEKLIDRLNLILFSGELSNKTRATVLNAINAIKVNDYNWRERRVITAVFLLTVSPEYVVQK